MGKWIAILMACVPSVYATRVYVDMVGDLFHYGHVALLERAKQEGDELIVGIHSDETVASYKRTPIMTMEERMAVVRGCRYVDEVIPNAPLHITPEYLEEHRIDLVVHGDDISDANKHLMYGEAIALGKFKLFPYTTGISTTDLIKRVLCTQ